MVNAKVSAVLDDVEYYITIILYRYRSLKSIRFSLAESTGVSLCSDKEIGQRRGAEAEVSSVAAPS